MPEHNPWIVAGIIVGTFVLWGLAVWFICNFIHVGMEDDDD